MAQAQNRGWAQNLIFEDAIPDELRQRSVDSYRKAMTAEVILSWWGMTETAELREAMDTALDRLLERNKIKMRTLKWDEEAGALRIKQRFYIAVWTEATYSDTSPCESPRRYKVEETDE